MHGQGSRPSGTASRRPSAQHARQTRPPAAPPAMLNCSRPCRRRKRRARCRPTRRRGRTSSAAFAGLQPPGERFSVAGVAGRKIIPPAPTPDAHAHAKAPMSAARSGSSHYCEEDEKERGHQMHLAAPITIGSRPWLRWSDMPLREALACLGLVIEAAFASSISNRSRPIDIQTIPEPTASSKCRSRSNATFPRCPLLQPKLLDFSAATSAGTLPSAPPFQSPFIDGAAIARSKKPIEVSYAFSFVAISFPRPGASARRGRGQRRAIIRQRAAQIITASTSCHKEGAWR